METFVYLLAILTALACTLLLLRSYRRTRARLLLWTALCFVGLTFSNLFLFLDYIIVPGVSLYVWRVGSALAGVAVLLYGFIWEID
ncbi:MAG: DUF5985 family protein [Gammaproteobacteria bacterium]